MKNRFFMTLVGLATGMMVTWGLLGLWAPEISIDRSIQWIFAGALVGGGVGFVVAQR